MASFDPQENVQVRALEALGKSRDPQLVMQSQQKHSLERLEPTIRKLIKISIPTDLERLEKHKINIDKYRKLQDWEKLNAEQINAIRTVQQLKSTLHEMELTKNQIRDEDLPDLEKRVEPITKKAITAIIAFMESIQELSTPDNDHQTDCPSTPEGNVIPLDEISSPLLTQQKHSLKRLEPAIQQFIKIAIPTNLERLEKHSLNIDKYRKLKEWEKLNTEQINASRTVQQLKSTIREMELAKSRIQGEDLPELDRRVGPLREQAIASIIGFLDSTKEPSSPDQQPQLDSNPLEDPKSLPPLPNDREQAAQTPLLPAVEEPATQPLMPLANEAPAPSDAPQSPLVFANHENSELAPPSTNEHGNRKPLPADGVPPRAAPQPQSKGEQLADQAQLQVQVAVEESWGKLKEDLIELNTMIHDFSIMVQDQQPKVDNIVDNVEKAQTHVEQGALKLGMATKVKAAMIPAAGAVIGGVIAGPIGLAAGLKMGALMAAVGGGAVGYGSGKLIKKKQEDTIQMELQNLSLVSDGGSSSSPEPKPQAGMEKSRSDGGWDSWKQWANPGEEPDNAEKTAMERSQSGGTWDGWKQWADPESKAGADSETGREKRQSDNSWESWKQWASATTYSIFDDAEPRAQADSGGAVDAQPKPAAVAKIDPAKDDRGESSGSWSDWKLW